MQNSYQRYTPFDGNPRFAHLHPFRVWCAEPDYLGTDDVPPDAFGVERCQQEIKSGRYHAIVVLDYSSPYELRVFENNFGKLLQEFAAAGGAVAFPTSEGLIVSSLKKLFNVQWKMASYRRTTRVPCLTFNENGVHESFGNGKYGKKVLTEYSSKAVSMRDVPHHERCFGVTELPEPYEVDSEDEDEVPEPDDANYETVVATHAYGDGVIAYFGDVNAEDHTIELVAAFVESRAPLDPVNCFLGLGWAVAMVAESSSFMPAVCKRVHDLFGFPNRLLQSIGNTRIVEAL